MTPLRCFLGGERWLGEGRGVVVLLKLALVALVPFAGGQRGILLVVIMIIASIGSHMPSRFRHMSLAATLRVGRGAAVLPVREGGGP